MVNTLYWHDYETTGVDPARDRPVQFAGVRTDEELNIIGAPLTLYCQPSADTLPHPQASLITGITPQLALAEGIPEPQFIGAILAQLAAPNTCGVGYNSIRFDDEVTRHTLYRNFHDPYEREWRQGNSRWDLIDMLRLTRALRPEGINWPNREDGSPSFKLEELTAANGLEHDAAHDALSDVMATIALARLVRDRQPKLYQYVYHSRPKRVVEELINLVDGQPFLHVSSRLPRENGYVGLMLPLARHPLNKNEIICFNLAVDPRPLLELDAQAIRARVFTATDRLPAGADRIPLKGVHINRSPVVATAKLLDAQTATRLGIDLDACQRHWQLLRGRDLRARLAEVYAPPDRTENRDPELALYGGFLPNQDKPLLAQIRQASGPELASTNFVFKDKRYGELLFRYRARHYPETLSVDERARWQESVRARLTDEAGGYLTLHSYNLELDRLQDRPDLSARDQNILKQLRAWGTQLAERL